MRNIKGKLSSALEGFIPPRRRQPGRLTRHTFEDAFELGRMHGRRQVIAEMAQEAATD